MKKKTIYNTIFALQNCICKNNLFAVLENWDAHFVVFVLDSMIHLQNSSNKHAIREYHNRENKKTKKTKIKSQKQL